MARKNFNRIVFTGAKAAKEQFKIQAASEVGVNLQNGYIGDRTSRQAGSISGQIVKKMCTLRHARFERAIRKQADLRLEYST